jgi:hypothetical protein
MKSAMKDYSVVKKANINTRYISFRQEAQALYENLVDVKWVRCHHGMACPQGADAGNGIQIWRVAANILNK